MKRGNDKGWWWSRVMTIFSLRFVQISCHSLTSIPNRNRMKQFHHPHLFFWRHFKGKRRWRWWCTSISYRFSFHDQDGSWMWFFSFSRIRGWSNDSAFKWSQWILFRQISCLWDQTIMTFFFVSLLFSTVRILSAEVYNEEVMMMMMSLILFSIDLNSGWVYHVILKWQWCLLQLFLHLMTINHDDQVDALPRDDFLTLTPSHPCRSTEKNCHKGWKSSSIDG